jgi:hypothetical protein
MFLQNLYKPNSSNSVTLFSFLMSPALIQFWYLQYEEDKEREKEKVEGSAREEGGEREKGGGEEKELIKKDNSTKVSVFQSQRVSTDSGGGNRSQGRGSHYEKERIEVYPW